MNIQSMFEKNIDRKINGVVKVQQDDDEALRQEIEEYVVTRELRRHFNAFFNSYAESFVEPTADVGVWISGFFGSGKSHFLKALSYILENKEIQGVKTVERFREKFDDPAALFSIDKVVKFPTETILFNIDVEGSINKDKTAVLRVFAKMFYKRLGFYGEDLKLAQLERYVAEQGKTEEFRRFYEERRGVSWLDSRERYAFFEDDIVATLREVLGMSEQAAVNWFNKEEAPEYSIAKLVSEIKEYVDGKPSDFRLLFMIDEVGQYIGEDSNLLLNLQSLVEEIGVKCRGKVWVVCTGQEAIDEIIKARQNEFSRIQARFKTRLSLSSSSADEVIQKRVLAKNEKAQKLLARTYEENDSVLRNLFTFTDSVQDIKGFSNADEFVRDFPFVPYQFILMQKVFAEIRKHGNSGKHLSGGERSMLSGFQEAAQKIKEKDERALAPFYLFYDTVHSFLDSSIRNVVERCARAAENDRGIKPEDVDVLKLLYLIRYINDVKANLDNIVILMADDLRLDKIATRERARASLERLLRENYIGRSGNEYNFLTDEEQDVQREIRNTPVATADIVAEIAKKLFNDVYVTKKFRYESNGFKYDFPFEQMVDGQTFGSAGSDMTLRIVTAAVDESEKSKMRMLVDSLGQAVVVLADAPYYESLEKAMKIRKYVKQRNVSQLPKSVQDIIRNQQNEADAYEKDALDKLKKAIVDATFYVDGESIDIKGDDAKSKLDRALEALTAIVYRDLEQITKNAETDDDILRILRGEEKYLEGAEPNREAVAEVEKFLDIRRETNLPTTMVDVQGRFQKKPYGWREIDVAAVVAMLIRDQKVVVKRGGAIVSPSDSKLPDLLRKKSEIGKTTVSKRQNASLQKLREARDFLRDFFDVMSVPEDEDGLIAYIGSKFDEARVRYEGLKEKYKTRKYPDRDKIEGAIELFKDVLSQRNDNIALIQRVIDRADALEDARDAARKVEEFFKTQVALFDEATDFEQELRVDDEYLAEEADAYQALGAIRQIVAVPESGEFKYGRVPELNALMKIVRAAHDRLLDAKREELLTNLRRCVEEIRQKADARPETKDVVSAADDYFEQKKEQIETRPTLALLNALAQTLFKYRDDALAKIDAILRPPVEPPAAPPSPKKPVKAFQWQALFPAKTLKSEEEIDAYVEEIRAKMKDLLRNCDEFKLN